MKECPDRPRWQSPDWCRTLQLVLATAWLLDGVLQLQPVMFSRGDGGLSGMMAGTAAGNPGPVASSITWASSVVHAHPAPWNMAFASAQILLGLGIAWRPTVRAALAASVPWALGVWWFGEGLGGILHGEGTPVLGGPGAVLVYALLAVVLWPRSAAGPGPGRGSVWFAASGALGRDGAKAVWAALWTGMGLLSLLGEARAPASVSGAIAGVDPGEPGWLAAVDRHAALLVAGRGLAVALALAAVCLVVAVAVYLPAPAARAVIALGILTALAIWVVTENFGAVLAGGATDPNSGPLLVVLALAYWPRGLPHAAEAPAGAEAPAPSGVVAPAGAVAATEGGLAGVLAAAGAD